MDFLKHSLTTRLTTVFSATWPGVGLAASGALVLVVGGCTTTGFKEAADKEVYDIIESASPEVPGMTEDYEIEPERLLDLSDLPIVEEAPEYLGEEGELEVGAGIVSLEKALELAFRNNRSYQNQKEMLYLTALDLTLERHQYRPRFFGRAQTTLTADTRDEFRVSTEGQIVQTAPNLVREVGQLAGTPGDLLSRYARVVESAGLASGVTQPRREVVDERRVTGSAATGADMLVRGGAQVAVDLTSNFLRFITGDPRTQTSSALGAAITQPLLRGAGRRVADEALTQAERNLLYQLRSFTRFRQEFAIDVASAYYRVLQNRDMARNNYLGYEAFLQGAERQRALAEAGRVTETDLGRSVQAELSAEDSWTRSIRAYRESLDQFKILLGLSTDALIVLDDNELDELREHGLIHPDLEADEAASIAMAARLDLYTTVDEVHDAARRVDIATNALQPRADVTLAADVPSEPGDDRWSDLSWRRLEWRAGVDLDLALDRKAQRNAFRRALINYERALRSLELAEDNVKLDVRSAWRNLEQAERSFRIREIGVEVNERRVREQELLAEAGRATTLDQIDAQNDLVAARNTMTAALIDHTLARLALWRDMGLLYIKPDGQWEELSDIEEL